MTSLDDLRKLARQVSDATAALEALRHRRDEAIRDVRRAGVHTVREIAEAAGVSEATVKAVVRGLR